MFDWRFVHKHHHRDSQGHYQHSAGILIRQIFWSWETGRKISCSFAVIMHRITISKKLYLFFLLRCSPITAIFFSLNDLIIPSQSNPLYTGECHHPT